MYTPLEAQTASLPSSAAEHAQTQKRSYSRLGCPTPCVPITAIIVLPLILLSGWYWSDVHEVGVIKQTGKETQPYPDNRHREIGNMFVHTGRGALADSAESYVTLTNLGMHDFESGIDQWGRAFGKGRVPASPNEYGIVRVAHNPNLAPDYSVMRRVSLMRSETSAGNIPESDLIDDSDNASGQSTPEVVAEITHQKWTILPAGTELTLDHDRKGTILSDLAGLELSFTVRNRTDSAFAVHPPLLLVGANGQQVSRFNLLKLEPPQGDVDRLGAIEIASGQDVLMEFQSRLENVTDLRSASPLFLDFPTHGWRLPVAPLPEHKTLLKNMQ